MLTIDGRPHNYGRDIFYEIDISTKTTSAKLLDLVVQVSKKRWSTDAIVSDLIRKMDEALNIQANICSWGRDAGNFDAEAHLTN
jgi:hypothetical protein